MESSLSRLQSARIFYALVCHEGGDLDEHSRIEARISSMLARNRGHRRTYVFARARGAPIGRLTWAVSRHALSVFQARSAIGLAGVGTKRQACRLLRDRFNRPPERARSSPASGGA